MSEFIGDVAQAVYTPTLHGQGPPQFGQRFVHPSIWWSRWGADDAQSRTTVGAATRSGEAAIDDGRDFQFATERPESRYRAVRKGADADRIGGLQAGQQVVGLAEIQDRDGPGFPVDTAGFDDPPVGVSVDANGLKARHSEIATARPLTHGHPNLQAAAASRAGLSQGSGTMPSSPDCFTLSAPTADLTPELLHYNLGVHYFDTSSSNTVGDNWHTAL